MILNGIEIANTACLLPNCLKYSHYIWSRWRWGREEIDRGAGVSNPTSTTQPSLVMLSCKSDEQMQLKTAPSSSIRPKRPTCVRPLGAIRTKCVWTPSSLVRRTFSPNTMGIVIVEGLAGLGASVHFASMLAKATHPSKMLWLLQIMVTSYDEPHFTSAVGPPTNTRGACKLRAI